MITRKLTRNALTFAIAGLLVGGCTTAATADPTESSITPVPVGSEGTPGESQGPLGGRANAPIQPVAPPCAPRFSCPPNQVSTDPGAAAPGPTPNVSPVLTHSNSGANHDNLIVDGVDFTPKESVHFEVLPNHPGDFAAFDTDRDAIDSGTVHVEFYGHQTASPKDPHAKGGYVIATGSVSKKTTPPLQVTIFPPVTIDNG